MSQTPPIVELEVDGGKRLYYADRENARYVRVGEPEDIVYASEVDADMEEIINKYEVKT